MAHFPALQTAEPFAAGVGQETQVAPQALVLVSGWQVLLLQMCIPVGQTPLQGVAVGMQAPAHSLDPRRAALHAGQAIARDRASAGRRLAGACTRSNRWARRSPSPCCRRTCRRRCGSRRCTSPRRRRWSRSAVPLESVGQTRQAVPQPVASSSGAQRALAPVPHRWVPTPQVKLQVVPLQLVELAPVGFGQDVHNVPQLSTLVFEAQRPVQSWVAPEAHAGARRRTVDADPRAQLHSRRAVRNARGPVAGRRRRPSASDRRSTTWCRSCPRRRC